MQTSDQQACYLVRLTLADAMSRDPIRGILLGMSMSTLLWCVILAVLG